MKVCFYSLVFIFLLLCSTTSAAELSTATKGSQISELQRIRTSARLYAPNFVLVGENAEFKVLASPNEEAVLHLDYGYSIDKQVYKQKTNEQGVAAFVVPVIKDNEFVGKSVAVEAYVYNEKTGKKRKAFLQNESGSATSYNRVYIADKDSAKGVLFTPWKSLNQFIMNTSYDERSGYDPLNDQLYDDTTPIYVRNMRDAQENVREVPRNSNYTD